MFILEEVHTVGFGMGTQEVSRVAKIVTLLPGKKIARVTGTKKFKVVASIIIKPLL